MSRSRLRAIGALGTVALTGGFGGIAALMPRAVRAQQAWPSKPIRIVVPFVAGGSSDIVGRSVVQRMQTALGQNLVVENRPGANGAIAASEVALAPADGYTFMVGSIGVFAINAALYPKLPYDPLKDLEPLTLAVVTPNVLVAGEKFPARDVKSLIAYAEQNPGRLSWASSGTGSSDHLSGRALQAADRHLRRAHPVSGRRGGDGRPDRQQYRRVVPEPRRGEVAHPLGAAQGARRDQRAPPSATADVPTVVEHGLPGFVVTSWQAFMGPKGMPPEIRRRLHAGLVAALNAPEVRERFATQGFDVVANTPEQYSAFQRAEIERWSQVVKQKGVTPD